MTKIERLEQRAKKLQEQLDRVQGKWEEERFKMQRAGTWKKYCDDNDFIHDYAFRDLLC